MAASEWAWFSLVLVSGCSSTTNITNANCGPGTVLKDGVCVSEVTDSASDSSAPIDAADAIADSRDDDAPLIDTGTPGDSMSSDVSSAETIDSGVSDICPIASYMDCSGKCGKPVDSRCAMTTCRAVLTASPDLIVKVTPSELPLIIRTPEKPGSDPKCAKCEGLTVYSMGLRINGGSPLRVTVGAPWRVGSFTFGTYAYCDRGDGKTGCYSASYSDIQITTTDPNAPARNVKVELTPASCP